MKIDREVEDILGQFFANHNKVERMSEQLHKDLSNVDKELAEFYHKVEGIHLSHNTQAHNHMLELKDILARRRQLKKDTILIRCFIDNTKSTIDLAKKRTESALEKHNKVLAKTKIQK